MKFILCLRHWLGTLLLVVTFSVAAAPPEALELLAQARTAAGAGAWRQVAALQAQGDIESSKMPGRWMRTEDVRSGRWRYQMDLGVHRFAEGFDGLSPGWRQDKSDGVHRLNSAYARAHQASESWLTRRGWLLAHAGGAKLNAVREAQAEDGHPYWVLSVVPPKGNPLALWFDPRSHLLSRVVREMPTAIATDIYSEYRAVDGVQLPHRIEQRSTETTDVDLITVTRWRAIAPPSRSVFAMPPLPKDHTVPPKGTALSIDIDGHPLVPALVNGKPMVFILDSGGHNILTPEAAQALGLSLVGQGASSGSGEGETAQQFTRVDKLQIGEALLRDQHFYVMPFSYSTIEHGSRPVLAGLLGLEIFERFLVRLDYPGKKLSLKPFATGLHRGPYRGPGVAVPIEFFDDMPLLPGRINGIPGLLALDTGNSGTTVVQHHWARQHGLAEKMKAGLETVSYGQGGASRNWVSRGESIEVAGIKLPGSLLRYAEDKAGAFASITEAANIGSEVLSHFVVEFDYSRSQIWFDYRPGVFAPMPFSRAGLRAIKTEPDVIKAVVVTPNGPAAVAGVRAEDEIVAADGQSVASLSGRDFNLKMVQPAGTPLRLTIRRDGLEREVSITLAEMLP